MVLGCQPEERTVAGTGNVFFGKMDASAINDGFVAVAVDVDDGAFDSHGDVVPFARADVHLGNVVENKVARSDFISNAETVGEGTGRSVADGYFELGVTVDVTFLDVFEHAKVVAMDLQDFLFGTGIVGMSGMGEESLEFDIDIRSDDVNDTVNFLVIVGIDAVAVVAGVHAEIDAYGVFEAGRKLLRSFGMGKQEVQADAGGEVVDFLVFQAIDREGDGDVVPSPFGKFHCHVEGGYGDFFYAGSPEPFPDFTGLVGFEMRTECDARRFGFLRHAGDVAFANIFVEHHGGLYDRNQIAHIWSCFLVLTKVGKETGKCKGESGKISKFALLNVGVGTGCAGEGGYFVY